MASWALALVSARELLDIIIQVTGASGHSLSDTVHPLALAQLSPEAQAGLRHLVGLLDQPPASVGEDSPAR
jgi:hypothetical protein